MIKPYPQPQRSLAHLYMIETCVRIAIVAQKYNNCPKFCLVELAEKCGLIESNYHQYWKECSPEVLANINFEECKEYLKKKLDL